MATKPKNSEQERKKPNETKIYHTDDERLHVERRVRDGKFKNRQEYYRELVRQDRIKHSR